MSNNTFATQASCPGKEEPLHVNHAETLDIIRQHVKDKVERQQQVVISGAAAGEGGQVIQVVQVLPVKVHPILDGQGEEYKQKELVYKKELPLNLQINLLPVLKC
ncbi:hypothetical protein Tco_1035783 [Tanacetum coccineum]